MGEEGENAKRHLIACAFVSERADPSCFYVALLLLLLPPPPLLLLLLLLLLCCCRHHQQTQRSVPRAAHGRCSGEVL